MLGYFTICAGLKSSEAQIKAAATLEEGKDNPEVQREIQAWKQHINRYATFPTFTLAVVKYFHGSVDASVPWSRVFSLSRAHDINDNSEWSSVLPVHHLQTRITVLPQKKQTGQDLNFKEDDWVFFRVWPLHTKYRF